MWVLSFILYSLDTAAVYNYANSNCQWATTTPAKCNYFQAFSRLIITIFHNIKYLSHKFSKLGLVI